MVTRQKAFEYKDYQKGAQEGGILRYILSRNSKIVVFLALILSWLFLDADRQKAAHMAR
jgi:hypothetical protein